MTEHKAVTSETPNHSVEKSARNGRHQPVSSYDAQLDGDAARSLQT